MQIVYEYVNFSSSESLEVLVDKQLSKLHKKNPTLIKADVYFKVENNKGLEDFLCSIRLSLPGPQIYASSTENDMHKAIRETVKDLQDQLEKRKGKLAKH